MRAHFGIKSANQKVLDYYNKQTTPEQAKVAVKNARKAGVDVIVGSFTLGAPNETRQEMRARLKRRLDAQPPKQVDGRVLTTLTLSIYYYFTRDFWLTYLKRVYVTQIENSPKTETRKEWKTRQEPVNPCPFRIKKPLKNIRKSARSWRVSLCFLN